MMISRRFLWHLHFIDIFRILILKLVASSVHHPPYKRHLFLPDMTNSITDLTSFTNVYETLQTACLSAKL